MRYTAVTSPPKHTCTCTHNSWNKTEWPAFLASYSTLPLLSLRSQYCFVSVKLPRLSKKRAQILTILGRLKSWPWSLNEGSPTNIYKYKYYSIIHKDNFWPPVSALNLNCESNSSLRLLLSSWQHCKQLLVTLFKYQCLRIDD